MIKYAKVINEEKGRVIVGLDDNIAYYQSIGMTQQDVELSDVDNAWYLSDKCPHLTPEQKEEKEKERISHLKCTKRVLVLILEQLGFDYFQQIEPLINSNRQAKLEWELCVELERSNPLLDVIGAELGLSSTDIDNIFKYANGEIENINKENE